VGFIALTSDGFLSVSCEYEERNVVKEIGGRWDGVYKVWNVAFTIENLDYLLANVKDVGVSDALERRVESQMKKEERLKMLRAWSKADAPVRLKVPGLNIPLYNYQRIGVMYALTNEEGVLIADEMGLGKTLQAIATALILKDRGKADCALIVTPASLKFNWPIEIDKFTEEKYVVVDGTPDERIAQWLRDDVFFYIVNYELLLEDLFGGREMKKKDDETAAQRERRESITAKSKKRQRILRPARDRVWGMLAVDEAHYLKNGLSKRSKNVKRLKARMRMALTGTPMDGRLEELHSVMDFVMPGLLESRTRFLQKHAIVDFWGKIEGYKKIGEVREKVAPYFIRRLKKDVLDDLPDKIYENRMVLLTPSESRMYKNLAEKGHEATEDAEAMVCVIRCKQLCDHPILLDRALVKEGYESDPKLTKMKASKMEALKEVLDEVVVENGHKVVLFSQYKKMLDIIVEVLDEMGLSYLRIDGDTDKRERAAMQERFNTDNSIDMMVGTEAMSTGLNFTGADYVVNYDDNWAPAFMAQREDRCHRIGQKNVVTVINFICRGTIEERIRSVLYAKNKISAQALGDDWDEAVLKRLGPKDVARML
jgi:SNF2 family DNA or RNA helicase